MTTRFPNISEVITDSKAQRTAIILLCISDNYIDTMLVINFETQADIRAKD